MPGDSNGCGSLGTKMGKVVSLNKDAELRGSEATTSVVTWLRNQADALEKGEVRPAQKAILVTYESLGEQYLVSSAYCNATSIERAGMLSMADPE